MCHSEGGLYIPLPIKNLAATTLLDDPLKDIIVNPADLPWWWIKRLTTSGERVNHGSWVKMYNLCRVSTNCYNSRAHGHEWLGKLTKLWVLIIL